MNGSDTITAQATTRADLFAFRINGKVSRDDMEGMAKFMNDVFDRHDKVDMLLIFDRYEGSDFGAGLNWESMKANLRSLTEVRRYVVAGAPEGASDMVETMGKLLPVETEAFDTEAEAWASLGAASA